MTHCQCAGADRLFSDRVARLDLRRYRKQGPLKTTRLLLEALKAEGVGGATLLDIGGGVGAIPNDLLNVGARSATAVDASQGYLEAARAEAERQGNADAIRYHHGDFVEIAPEIPPADIVTLDRVICCYDDMEALVTASADRAERLYGVVYPRDDWWVRLGRRVVNFTCWVRRNPFRTFIYPTEAVEGVIRSRGLVRSFHRRTLIWQVAVYRRVR